PDGALWITEYSTIGRVTIAGAISSYAGYEIAHPVGIAAGPDGALWFTLPSKNTIARITDQPKPHLAANPASAAPSTVVQVSGSDFGSFELVKISFVDSVSGATVLGSVTTDASGRFTTQVTIPAGATSGSQRLRAR